jgi:hypothetical protein
MIAAWNPFFPTSFLQLVLATVHQVKRVEAGSFFSVKRSRAAGTSIAHTTVISGTIAVLCP